MTTPPRTALPYDHPVIVEALARTAPNTAQAAADRAARGHDIWLAWYDTIPEVAYQQGPTPGHLVIDPRTRDGDPYPVGAYTATTHKTARTHLFTTTDGIELTLPVWRWGRNDTPHNPVCDKVCGECGTGDYWLLPEYAFPAPHPGLSDPENPDRLRRDIAMLMALAFNPFKVVLTDEARYRRGTVGKPEPVLSARLMSVHSGETGDRVRVKYNQKRGGETMLAPRDIMLKEDHPMYATGTGTG